MFEVHACLPLCIATWPRGSVQQVAVFCAHIVFLTDQVTHTQMQNPPYTANVSIMLEQIHVFKTNIMAEQIVL